MSESVTVTVDRSRLKMMGYITVPIYFREDGGKLQLLADDPEITLEVQATNAAIVQALKFAANVCAVSATPEWVGKIVPLHQ